MSAISILDPHPDDWLTSERSNSITSQILPIYPLLKNSRLLGDVIKAWIIDEIRTECAGNISTDDDLSDADVQLFFARKLWGHRLESLYLRKKSRLDLISYSLLRVNSRDLAYELYHRIKAKEDSFEHLCLEYSTGLERFKGGRIERQSIADFPDTMQSYLLNLKEGELHQPVRFGSDYAVIQVLEHIPACFDDATEDRLLMWEFGDWISGVTTSVVDHLECRI